jgi:hypothetical protein
MYAGIKIDKIFLDTTYAHPKHKFMTQAESISIITEQAIAFFNENPEGLILLGSMFCFICYIFPSHEFIFLIDFILYSCRSGWSVLVSR